MGLTYAEAMSKSKQLKKRNVMILDSSPEKILSLKKNSHFDVFENLEDCLPQADLVFIAVKPHLLFFLGGELLSGTPPPTLPQGRG